MTFEKFCELLKVHREKRVWEIVRKEGGVACIRGRTPAGTRRDCPLTFLAHVLGVRRLFPMQYRLAAVRLGIPTAVAGAIVQAADTESSVHRLLRQAMLRALGLPD